MRAVLALLLLSCGGTPGQHRVEAAGELLSADGRLREPGWAPRQLLRWNAGNVHDPARLRQWDFYSFLGNDAAVNLTLVDLGFMQVCSAAAVELATGARRETLLIRGPHDLLSLSTAAFGDSSFTLNGATAMSFSADGIEVDIPATLLGDAAHGSFVLQRDAAAPYLSLATPFRENPFFFFFEQKVPTLRVTGSLAIGDKTFSFDGAPAVLDWGRGEWPSAVTWRWAAGVGDGIAFNLGQGFGDDSAGTENLAIRGTAAEKLDRVAWLPGWKFEGSGVSLVLTPDASEDSGLDLGTKYQKLHKVYGTFSGTIGATRVDGARGFAEEMELQW